MITLDTEKFRNLIEGGDLEPIREGDQIVFLANRRTMLTMPAEPLPQVSVSPTNVVSVRSGSVPVAEVQADDSAEAETFAEVFSAMIETACLERCIAYR